ncbi:hypothetical protein OBBRIDRAFT_735877, partial [Obba rivulosa]
LTKEVLAELKQSILSVRSVLVKLCKTAYAIIHSLTKLLPAWYVQVTSCCLKKMMMPCNVATHWNLTYWMLVFAVEYFKALNAITVDHFLNLCKHKMSKKN